MLTKFLYYCPCRCDRTLFPVDLKNFIEQHESVSSGGNQSKGEGLVTQLEEVNKSLNLLNTNGAKIVLIYSSLWQEHVKHGCQVK